MVETFWGYCFTADGWHTPPVALQGPEQAVGYANLHKHMFVEVRIVDADDAIVLQAKHGRIVYPVVV